MRLESLMPAFKTLAKQNTLSSSSTQTEQLTLKWRVITRCDTMERTHSLTSQSSRQLQMATNSLTEKTFGTSQTGNQEHSSSLRQSEQKIQATPTQIELNVCLSSFRQRTSMAMILTTLFPCTSRSNSRCLTTSNTVRLTQTFSPSSGIQEMVTIKCQLKATTSPDPL